MKAEYKRDLQNNYMILEAADAAEEGYRLKMAEQNQIAGLLDFCSSRRDGRLYLNYEITSKQSIETIYARNTMNYQDILLLLQGISDTLEELQKYLLNPAQLLFDPQFLFTYPDKSRYFLCYLPGENETSILGLAEFILKRLDHEDRRAVVLGYQFYQKALEENFSLQKTLKDILLSGENALYSRQDHDGNDGRNYHVNECGIKQYHEEDEKYEREVWKNEKRYEKKQAKQYEKPYEKPYEKRGVNQYEKNSDYDEKNNLRKSDSKDGRWREETDLDERDGYEIIHKSRQKKSKAKAAVDWVFDRIHPLVILSMLIFVILIEGIFWSGLISLTEAGGIFFLVISVEILINKYWKSRSEKKYQEWQEEEMEPEYHQLQYEMYHGDDKETYAKVYSHGNSNKGEGMGDGYGASGRGNEGMGNECEISENGHGGSCRQGIKADCVQETRYLIPESASDGLRLVCIGNQQEKRSGMYPDILIGTKILYIGKIQGESDVLLASSTVSRIHAQLEKSDERYYVKDLNSRNGTFVNGERLMPQERREIAAGDNIAFAEIMYQAK